MKTMLINATHPDEIRVAIINNRQLLDLDTEHPDQKRKKSDIYKGIITSIEPSLGAVFVNYGSERHGFLPLKEISPEYFMNHEQDHLELTQININSILKVGQEVVVQVDKEERGNKGAALTTFISLAGAYLVLMPNSPDAGGISRRIDGEDRDQLRESIAQLEIPEGMGVIVRTAGVNKNKDELQWDLNILLRYWEAIKKAAVARAAPYLIHQEGDVIIRAIRDYLRQDVNEIIIDEQNAYEKAKQHIEQVRPDFMDRLKLYADPVPLFSRFQVEQQIEAAYQHEVRLPSGGAIVIDQTEALVSIDVNSSRATKGRSIEETALNTNLEAADEIARQLRIRDTGGLIVIDFIDMTPVRNQREVENRLREALSVDRARVQTGRISRFGLLEMSRQRLRSALSKASLITCPRCSGKGLIRSVESAGLSIVHMIQEQALVAAPDSLFQVQLPLEVATYIMNEKRGLIEDIEKNNPVKVMIIPNQNLQTPNHSIRLISKEEANREGYFTDTPSYKMLQAAKVETPTRRAEAKHAEVEPAVAQFLADQSTLPANPHRPSAFSRFVKQILGIDESKPKLYKATAVERSPQGRHTPERPAREERAERNPRERGPRPPRERTERGERPQRNDRSEKGERTERAERPDPSAERNTEQRREGGDRTTTATGEPRTGGANRSRNRRRGGANRDRNAPNGPRQEPTVKTEGAEHQPKEAVQPQPTHQAATHSATPAPQAATHSATPAPQQHAPVVAAPVVHAAPVVAPAAVAPVVTPVVAPAAPQAASPVVAKAKPRRPQRIVAPAQDTATAASKSGSDSE